MVSFKKNKKKDINYLELTPYKKHSHEINEKGRVDVLVPRFDNKLLEKIFIPKSKSKFIKANLDEFGSETWLLIDGENKVRDLAELLKSKFGDRIHPVYNRLTLFLTQLHKNGFIDFLEFKKDR
ncbi:MAG: PqqD family protein [Candidatus Kapaibacterium sp.]